MPKILTNDRLSGLKRIYYSDDDTTDWVLLEEGDNAPELPNEVASVGRR